MLKNISRVPAAQLLRTERSIKRLRTAKVSNGKHKKPEGQPCPKGGKVLKVITVRYYKEAEE
jgi:hypothetical protein